MGQHRIAFEHKNILSIKRQNTLSSILSYFASPAYKEGEECVMISEKILGKPFKENSIVRVAAYFDPLLNRDYKYGERELFSYKLHMRYVDDDTPVILNLPSEKDIAIVKDAFGGRGAGEYELVLEEIINDGFLRLSLQKEK